MKFVIPKKTLASIALAVGPNAARKSSMPALGSVMLVVANGEATFTATDLFTGARGRVQVDEIEPGGVLVPAPQLMTAVKSLPDGDVTVRIDGNHIEFKCEKVRQRLPWSAVGDYPSLPQMDASKAAGVSSATLLAAISSVSHSMSTDEQRPNLCGVKLEFDGTRCRAIASNGHTLARRDVECSVHAPDVFIPHKSVSSVRSILDAAKGAGVGFAVHDGHLFIEHEAIALSVKLTGEMFPTHYETLLPKGNRRRLTVSREMLAVAVDRVRVQDGGLPFSFRFEDGVISLSAKCADGEGNAEVDCDFAGEPVTVGLSGPYLASALAAMTADVVAIEFGGPLDAVLIVPLADRNSIQMIMPARLP